ncbi:MAG: phosphate/phosphite/phosphonate ABC transporter substrate-binding protein [Kiritimatiellae bacterium]|nr:phosphate/phosphite/phosphonate ABC transporter substrate-binding protein [Kiritimatiellia bacterium]
MSKIDTASAGHTRSPFVCFALACIAVGLAIGVIAFTFLDRDGSELGPEVSVDLHQGDGAHETDSRPPAAAGAVLRVAIAPVISPEASVEQYGDLIAFLAHSLGVQPVLLRGKNYSEVNDLIRMRQCDMALVCTYSYVLAEVAFGARLLVAPEVEGRRVYHSLILVRTASSATKLTDLRDQRFASCDVLSTSGWLYPVTVLKQQGIDTARFFSKHIISGSHDRSVFAVQSGLVDAAAVDSIVYEHMVANDPALGRQLKVIHRSPPFGMPPLVVPADLPPDRFAKLQRVLLDMHTHAKGKRILASLGFDLFFDPGDEDYDTVRSLHTSWLNQP